MSKIKTIDLKGNDYAQVSERIKAFREDCPNGLIKTNYEIQDTTIIFTAIVVKDKAKKESAEATGHSYGSVKGVKQFEKLETIAVGRALALLGYLGSGEIASSEEMQEFYQYREEKIEEAILKLHTADKLDDLKEIFLSLGTLMSEPQVIEAKDVLKKKLSEVENENN